ncbi:MAG: phospholipase [Rhodanobacter sp.]|nr:MAG: phospholipase [Rhodanobacter sp.]TAM02628.1 MAG: phospholipase [Rhodanobacter sp.]TAM41585.1 MAG: phospholipase [Rhodanobacter sp.]TAN28308.1 MAG: phospholipase [Rhodanobacter sp.]
MRFHLVAACAALAWCVIATTARAQNPNPTDIRGCTAIENDAQRLACYDHATGRVNLPAAQKRQAAVPSAGVFGHEHEGTPAISTPGNSEVATPLSLLDSRWELSPESKLGTFNVRGYKPVYVLPIFASSNQNNRARSPNPDNTASADEGLENIEAKFQLSLKSKVWQGVFGDAGDVWVGYTQSSRWQVYNTKQSRPFRETDYEPEAMLVFNTNYHVLGWDGRLLGIGLDHQSNGRGNPLSRGWNRIIANVGFERDGWTVMLRPWWRIPESRSTDDNPDISNYMGRGEVQVVHEWHGQEFGLALRDSFRGGSQQHGSARFSWSFPIAGNLRGYAEVFKGYGESLIDYNHNATYLGLGVSLLDWY